MYAKLFSRITESSIIEESITTRWVFVALLAIAEEDGTIIGTDIAIARRINVPIEQFQSSMKILMTSDEDSNNKEYEGKRVIQSEGERGYFLTGYRKYRNLKTKADRRSYMKGYMQEYRESGTSVNNVNNPLTMLAKLTQAEAEAEAEADIKKEQDSPNGSSLPISPSLTNPPSFIVCQSERKKVGLNPLALDFRQRWEDSFKVHFGEKYLGAKGKDGGMINHALATFEMSNETIMEAAKKAWQNPNGFWSSKAVTISGFISNFTQIRKENGGLKPVPVKNADGSVMASKSSWGNS